MPTTQSSDAKPLAFCRALAAETEGMLPGSWRMLDTIAQRLGVGFFQAETLAQDCVRRGWVQLEADSVRLEDAGRMMVAKAS